MILIALIIALVALVIATITDLKTREVPDYISYGLMFSALAIAITYSIVNWNYEYLAQSAMGFIIGLIIAYSMFYLGQWGGGDSKLIMGLGAILGFNILPLFNINTFGETNIWLIILIANIILFGALYGLFWSISLAIIRRKVFIENLKLWMQKKEIIIARRILILIITLMLIAILTLLPQEYRLTMLLFVLLLYLLFYMWLFVKIIEESCMIKDVPIEKLTEGDWIFKDVYVGKKGSKLSKKPLAGPKDLGISIQQIELLKKYKSKGMIKTVKVKEGIPFIPAFLIAYIATIIIIYFGIPFI